MIESDVQRCVDAVMLQRRSVRAFLPRSIDREDIEGILQCASRAPSGTNTQPWMVYVLQGDSKERLSREILRIYGSPQLQAQHAEEYAYYPVKWISPFIDRRRKVGWDLYSLLGLTRENKKGMHAQLGRNFTFFDAPVALFFTIDRIMSQGSWLDYGMFLQSIMIAAQARGLGTCAQAAFTPYHRVITEQLGLPNSQMLVCGMALGYADPSKIENTLITERDGLDAFVRFND